MLVIIVKSFIIFKSIKYANCLNIFSLTGLPFCYRLRQHVIPKFANKKWKETHVHRFGGHAVKKFLNLYREKMHNIKRKERKYVNFFKLLLM